MTFFAPMTEAEFASYVEASVPAYARDKVESGQWSEAESLGLARSSHKEMLPLGIATPSHFLYTLRGAATQSNVGVLWYACQEQGGRKLAYVYDVLVQPEHRRQGHATRAFTWLEQQVRERGLSGIALHVFGHNTVACDLYVRLGFRATNISMFKAVGLPITERDTVDAAEPTRRRSTPQGT
jgi:ribosomal protein S18 acetylase RimI-like enzyme